MKDKKSTSRSETSRVRKRETSTAATKKAPFLKIGWRIHFIVFLLASLIWWGVRQSVSKSQILENQVNLEAVLDPHDQELRKDFRVYSQPDFKPPLRLTGPQDELSRYQEILERKERGSLYQFVITKNDIGEKKPDHNHQIVLDLQVQKFQATKFETPKEIDSELINSERTVKVVLEKRVKKAVDFDPQKLPIILPQGYKAQVEINTEVDAFGPWSYLQKIADPKGKLFPELVPLDLTLELSEKLQKMSPEEKENFFSQSHPYRMALQPLEGVEFLNSKKEPLSAISITLTFGQDVKFEDVTQTIPITILMPYWMVEKRVEFVSTSSIKDFKLRLLVNPQQKSAFNAENVKLILDLHDITPAKLDYEEREDADPLSRVGRITMVPLRLEVNREKLSYLIPPDINARAERYDVYDLTILWRE